MPGSQKFRTLSILLNNPNKRKERKKPRSEEKYTFKNTLVVEEENALCAWVGGEVFQSRGGFEIDKMCVN